MGILAAMLLLFCACNDETSSTSPQAETVVRDSVVICDSVVIRDSVRVVDSVNVIDSLNVRDSVHVVDSLNIVDSALHVIDSVVIRDSLRIIDSLNITDSIHVIDSIRVIDSLHVTDSVNVRDSVVTYGPEHYFGECNALNSGVIKSATINGENRDYICDENTLFWRVANKVDWNDLYIYQSAVTDFTPVREVVQNLAESEKMIIVLRHAERGSDYSITGPLNDNGKKQAENLGKTIAGSLEFYYGASQFIRAHQTCNNIAKGRAEADTLADTIAVLNDDWFVKDTAAYNDAKKNHGGGWKVTSKWAYQGSYSDAFYDLNARSTELIDDYLIPAFENSGKQVGLFVSHDVVMVPLVVYASGKKINLKYYEDTNNRWLNYLGGIAIVFKPDGTRVFYVVKGLDSGTM